MKKRVEWIDAIKGLGILLVVLGHAPRDEMVNNSVLCAYIKSLIYEFHMPLYLAISGFLFGMVYKKYFAHPLEFVRVRLKSLFVPFISYASMIYVIFFVAYSIPAVSEMLRSSGYFVHSIKDYIYLTLLDENPYTVHIWYMWSLLLMLLASFGIIKLMKNNRYIHEVLMIGSLICYIVSLLTGFPNTVYKTLHYYIYFIIGFELYHHQERLQRIHLIPQVISWAILLFSASSLPQAYGLDHYVNTRICKFILLLPTALVIVGIFSFFSQFSKGKHLAVLGRVSYPIYLLHQPFFCGFIGVVLYNKLHLPIFLTFALCTACGILMPLLIVQICRRVRPLGYLAKVLFNIN